MPGLQKSVSLELNWQWLCSNSYLSKHMIVLVKIIPWIFFCHMLIYFVVCSSPVISTLDSPWDLRPCTAPQQSQRLFPPCRRNWCLQSLEQNIIHFGRPWCTTFCILEDPDAVKRKLHDVLLLLSWGVWFHTQPSPLFFWLSSCKWSCTALGLKDCWIAWGYH